MKSIVVLIGLLTASVLGFVGCSSSDCKLTGPDTACLIGDSCIQPDDCEPAPGCLSADCIGGICESLGCKTK